MSTASLLLRTGRGLPMRALRTALCTLEPQVEAHAAEMFAVLSDPAIYEFENAPPASVEWLGERFARLEARHSVDGAELWLNWVVRVPSGELAGYVQATVMAGGVSLVAYELASRFWRRGLGASAVGALQDELAGRYGVHTLAGVLKAGNFRSKGLLIHLGFSPASDEQAAALDVGADEMAMVKLLGPAAPPASRARRRQKPDAASPDPGAR